MLTAVLAASGACIVAWWRTGLWALGGDAGYEAIVAGGEGEKPACARRSEPLGAQCERMRDHLRGLLGDHRAAIVREPLVITGDLPAAELQRLYRETIGPCAQAMAARLFDASPSEPVAVVLFADQAAYERHARALLGRERVSPHGHYRPHLRTIVVSVARGDRALRHELTHALMAFDFPEAPSWLSEGIAALYETSAVAVKPPRITGLADVRLRRLQEAILENRLRPLPELIRPGGFEEGSARLNYAHARYLAMLLQDRGALAEYYRALRDGQGEGTWREEALRNALGAESWAAAEAQFRRFVLDLEGPGDAGP